MIDATYRVQVGITNAHLWFEELISGDETIRLWDVQNGQCLKTLRADGPYMGMNISGAVGLTAAQKAALKALGAVDKAAPTE